MCKCEECTDGAVETPDFTVENHGSIVLIRPLFAPVEDWLDEHTSGQWFGGALAVEPRYVAPIVEALISEGFDPA